MKAIKFLKEYEPYEPGHVVDLDDKLADKLINEGIAKEYASPVMAVTIVTEQNPEPIEATEPEEGGAD